MPKKLTYYDVLGVEDRASIDTVRNQYRKIVKIIHPELPSSVMFEKFRDCLPQWIKEQGALSREDRIKVFHFVQTAYDVLADPTSKKNYDFFLWRQRIKKIFWHPYVYSIFVIVVWYVTSPNIFPSRPVVHYTDGSRHIPTFSEWTSWLVNEETRSKTLEFIKEKFPLFLVVNVLFLFVSFVIVAVGAIKTFLTIVTKIKKGPTALIEATPKDIRPPLLLPPPSKNASGKGGSHQSVEEEKIRSQESLLSKIMKGYHE